MADPKAIFGAFLSCVEGQPVARFGTRVMIGATRTADAPTVVQYDPSLVVAIPHAEWGKHRRAYQRAIDAGSLRVRTAEDWTKQESAREKSEAEARQQKQARKAAAEAEAKKAAETPAQTAQAAPTLSEATE